MSYRILSYCVLAEGLEGGRGGGGGATGTDAETPADNTQMMSKIIYVIQAVTGSQIEIVGQSGMSAQGNNDTQRTPSIFAIELQSNQERVIYLN